MTRVIRYFCCVRGIGPVYGSGRNVTCVIAILRTESAETALRWLVGQVGRLADRLDPAPDTGMTLVIGPEVDGPSLLRAWCQDPAHRQAAWARLIDGRCVSLIFPDGLNHYRFEVSPELTPARARPYLEPPPPP
ncbi:hypothetical protein ACFVIM_07150 [Streptomyces sp. NPDC057638]|uniref:hypothetical protein n=1 Tax=Streptomyces sp. NPDC057638 TaxID=3346190 RepID=UPI0036BE193E